MQNIKTYSSHQETQPLVSFVIAYYDLPVQMLGKCIGSILALALHPGEREIIVIDDGSNVSPMNILMQYGEEIIYVRQKNAGLSNARNKGIEMATGQYIQFVDADDWLVAEPYNHCLNLLKQSPDTDMVIFDFTTTDKQQSSYKDTTYPSGTDLMRHHNIHGMACGYLFQKKTLSELRFTSGIYHEDEEFTPQLLIRSENIIVTTAQAYYYNQRPGSITNSGDNEKKLKRLDDFQGVLKRLNLIADRLPNNDRLAMQRRVAQLTMDYIYNTMVLTRSAKCIDQRIEELRAEGLFPLPDQNYSTKYTWFRRMTNSAMGRRILLATLPLMKKER